MDMSKLIEQARAVLKAKGHPFVRGAANDEGLLGHCYNCTREVRLDEAGQLVGAAVETACPQPGWL